jgi:hypothetical protein
MDIGGSYCGECTQTEREKRWANRHGGSRSVIEEAQSSAGYANSQMTATGKPDRLGEWGVVARLGS